MRVSYRGHEIDVSRDRCLAGYSLLYFSVFRESDGYECLSSYEDGAETIAAKIAQLKERIDAELAEDDPWCERGGL